MALLNKGNYKTRKGEKIGFKTFGLHLAPYNLSGFQVCPKASRGCSMACLNTAGRGAMTSTQRSRISKTKRFFIERSKFMDELKKEIESSIKSAIRSNFTPCFRLNLTSDIAWESVRVSGSDKSLIDLFPDVMFYDYTKISARMDRFLDGKMPKNYHLTFSRSEDTPDEQCAKILRLGGNVAIVFRGELPATWNRFPVIDGDDTDLRFLDASGVVVGLIEKGLAKKDESGFVLDGKGVV